MSMYDPGDKQPSSSSQPSSPSSSVGKNPLVADSSQAKAPAPSQASQDVKALAAMDIAGQVQAFANAGAAAHALVAAIPNMAADQPTARHTIAMFQYLHSHATTLAALINAKEIGEERATYLEGLAAAMSAKLGGKMLFSGDADRGMIAVGARDAGEFFRAGRAELLAFATNAHQQNKSLAQLLEQHSNNNDAKSYGRRLESVGTLSLDALRTEGGAGLQANQAYAHDLFTFYTRDFDEIGNPATIQPNALCIVMFEGSAHNVTVSANAGGHVTFSAVADYG